MYKNMTKNYTHIQTERKSRMITVEQWERINMILENPSKYSVSTITLQLDEDIRSNFPVNFNNPYGQGNLYENF